MPNEIFNAAFKEVKRPSPLHPSGQVDKKHTIYDSVIGTNVIVKEIRLSGNLYCVEIYDEVIDQRGIHSTIMFRDPYSMFGYSCIMQTEIFDEVFDTMDAPE